MTLRALGLASVFLLAREIVRFCESLGIIALARGSAVASIICHLLGVSEADPIRHELLFERFLHTGRRIMPDIDIDVSASRRDEVFSWLERRFGEHAAMACNRITYRLPLAVQDLGRALGLPKQLRDQLSRALGRDYRHLRPHRAQEALSAFDEVLGNAPVKGVLLALLTQMEAGFVRHIAPHSGGWVITSAPLHTYSPLERSSGGIVMLQFDKDDVERLGLIKLDILALRMLSALERTREEVARTSGVWLNLRALPDDPAVWADIQVGDTLGMFQVESPAQVQLSVKLKPRRIEDLKDQVALCRPGPLQSMSVHPYLARVRGQQPVSYLHPALEPVLKKTQGVLLFQEDVMRIAVVFAGFSWTEAELFRKKVTTFEDIHEIMSERRAFVRGAAATSGASEAEALAVFTLLSSFRGYGFAESHAWAFGLTAYKSAWLRHYYPAEYLAAFLSEHPGMWPKGTLRHEARRWGVGFRPLDINKSGLAYRVEIDDDQRYIRPSLADIKGVGQVGARAIILERHKAGPYSSVASLYQRLKLPQDTLEALIRAGAFDSLQSRRAALFQATGLRNLQEPGQPGLFAEISENGLAEPPAFPLLEIMERLQWDYALKGLSELQVHPIDVIRQTLLDQGACPMARLPFCGWVRTAGLIVARQRPPTAKGFAFFVLEDGPERLQLIISPQLWEVNREMLRDAMMLVAEGDLKREGRALTLRATALWDVTSPVTIRGYHYAG